MEAKTQTGDIILKSGKLWRKLEQCPRLLEMGGMDYIFILMVLLA